MQEDQFEKFVRNNREDFDRSEVPAGAWDKIKEKRKPKKTRIIQWMPRLQQVAAILIIGLAAFGVYSMFKSEPEVVKTEESQLPAEIAEMDRYYEAQVVSAMQELDQTEGVDKELTADVQEELDILQAEKLRLFDELKNDVNNEAILQELIQTYRMRLEVLEDVLSMIREINEEQEIKNKENAISL
ncbi:hypothetical protein GYB22_00340 [bacterium]|nr:hypothetical protein [bacterium]